MKIRTRFFNFMVLMLLSTVVLAQQSEFFKKPVPIDPTVKYGKLENGMTYYIKHNQEPKERASFYIIQNVGAILEEDDQNGLAHFLEHMAFNGTKHFPKKGLFTLLEKYGIEFGRNINAYTSNDETVYNLSDIPATNESLMDSCLLILHDWSNYLSLEAEEIDNERGVIKEEWRTRRSANFRMDIALRPMKYKGSKYAVRDVIGDINVIENFDYDVIRRFYHDWYRTDLQAIAIIGDFDADKMEQKVIELFSKIPAVENPKERVYFDVPDNKEPIIAMATDPEAQTSMMWLYYKHDEVKNDDKNIGYLRYNLIKELYAQMINQRFDEIVQKGTPPFIVAQSFYGSYTDTKDAYTTISIAKNNGLGQAMESVLIEQERLKRYGFTQGELERAKTNILRALESQYAEKDKKNNDDYAAEFVDHYRQNEPIPGVEAEYQFAKAMMPNITLEELNMLPSKWITKENMVLTFQGPEKEGITYPTKEEALALIQKVENMEIEPYEDTAADQPLFAEELEGSKIISEKKLPVFDAVEWTLANGVKVVLKKTDFKEDEIVFTAYSLGGSSLYSVEDFASAGFIPAIMGMYGVGDFDNITLQKMLSGKIVDLNHFLTEQTEGFQGNVSPKDFETLMQLIYLYFEKPRFDKEANDAFISRIGSFLENRGKDPNNVIQDSVAMITTCYNPRTKILNKEFLEEVDFEKIKKVYKERYADASDFTFIFSGNIDLEKAKPLIEKYIGSLTDIDREENWVNHHIEHPKGFTQKTIKMPLETPKSTVYINYNSDLDYTYKNKIIVNMLNYLFDIVYTEKIREEEGGTYGVRIGGNLSHYPDEEYNLALFFDCDPAKADHLTSIIYAQMEEMAKNGVDDEKMEKVRENLLKVREENLRKNKFWLNAIRAYYYDKQDVVSEENYNEIVKSITSKDIEKFVKKVLLKADKVEVILRPQE